MVIVFQKEYRYRQILHWFFTRLFCATKIFLKTTPFGSKLVVIIKTRFKVLKLYFVNSIEVPICVWINRLYALHNTICRSISSEKFEWSRYFFGPWAFWSDFYIIYARGLNKDTFWKSISIIPSWKCKISQNTPLFVFHPSCKSLLFYKSCQSLRSFWFDV